MKTKLDTSEILKKIKSLTQPLLKHLSTILFVVIGGFLIFAVYSVSQILNQPTDSQYMEEQQKNAVRSKFDDTTIQKIKELRNREEKQQPRFTGGPAGKSVQRVALE